MAKSETVTPPVVGKTFVATFVREKETKNTVKFEEKPEPGTPSLVGSIYVQKWVVGDAPLITVRITIG